MHEKTELNYEKLILFIFVYLCKLWFSSTTTHLFQYKFTRKFCASYFILISTFLEKKRLNLSIAICFLYYSSLVELIIASRSMSPFFVYFAFVLFTSIHLDFQTQEFLLSLVHFFCKWRQISKYKKNVMASWKSRDHQYNLKIHSNRNRFTLSHRLIEFLNILKRF